MTELKNTVDMLSSSGKTGLSFFVSGGYPSMEEFCDIVRFIDREKLADFLEIGIPFSDPVADGPVIQESSRKALEAGASYGAILKTVKKLKKEVKIPLVLMTYLNVPLAYGLREAFSGAAQAGFSAAIIPDMPYGEHEEVYEILKDNGIELILLVSPATSSERISSIAKLSSPFLYYVSSYGVTGGGKKFSGITLENISRVRKLSSVPVYCGFGITSPEEAGFIAGAADGEIIGSAVIDLIKEGDMEKTFKDIYKFAISIKERIKR